MGKDKPSPSPRAPSTPKLQNRKQKFKMGKGRDTPKTPNSDKNQTSRTDKSEPKNDLNPKPLYEHWPQQQRFIPQWQQIPQMQGGLNTWWKPYTYHRGDSSYNDDRRNRDSSYNDDRRNRDSSHNDDCRNRDSSYNDDRRNRDTKKRSRSQDGSNDQNNSYSGSNYDAYQGFANPYFSQPYRKKQYFDPNKQNERGEGHFNPRFKRTAQDGSFIPQREYTNRDREQIRSAEGHGNKSIQGQGLQIKKPAKDGATEEANELEDQTKAEATKSKVEELRKKLKSKKKSNKIVTDEEPGTDLERQDHPEPLSKMERLLNLNVTNDDYRDIGTGKTDLGQSQDSVNASDGCNHDLIEDYCRSKESCPPHNSKNQTVPHRIANQPVVGSKKKAAKKVVSRPKECQPQATQSVANDLVAEIEKERQKRIEYEKVAERLKPMLLKKDPKWLSAMINNTQTKTQRALLSKLLEENRTQVSKELNAMRLKNIQHQNQEPELSPSDLDPVASLEIDYTNLPDLFISTIENLIKKERPEIVVLDNESQPSESCQTENSPKIDSSIDYHLLLKVEESSSDSEVEEVPVPPKTPPPLIDLDLDQVDVDETQTKSSQDENGKIKSQLNYSITDEPNEDIVDATTAKSNEENMKTNPELNSTTDEPNEHRQTKNSVLELQRSAEVVLPANASSPSASSAKTGKGSPKKPPVKRPPKTTEGGSPKKRRRNSTSINVDNLNMMTEEERTIFNELKNLDEEKTDLINQMSTICQRIRFLDECRPDLMKRLECLREIKNEIINNP